LLFSTIQSYDMSKTIKRSFVLGEEWLYYKVYCGERTADFILEELVAPMTKELLRKKLIRQWFFIRYNDPDPHLRLRFNLSDVKKIGVIIETFNKHTSSYLQENLIWKIQTDMYVRELERYGPNTMTLSEELFFHDSELVLNALALIKDEEIYFLFILKCIDSFLTQLHFNTIEKLFFSKQNALAYKKEFELEKSTRRSLAKKYRLVSENLKKVFLNEGVTNKFITIEEIMLNRDHAIKNLTSKLLDNCNKKLLQVEFDGLLSSYIHMFVNRAFRSRQRLYEMLAYDFLYRHYSYVSRNNR